MSRIKTKFGVAKIISTSDGYKRYLITSRKEGNKGKLLHRLIWEDFYNTEVPKGYTIHHKNGNSLDNCILNLQLMRDKDHRVLHHKNKIVSNETKIKNGEVHKKYTLWDGSICTFDKRRPEKKSFRLRYNFKNINVGGFYEWISCEIINNLIDDALNKECDI